MRTSNKRVASKRYRSEDPCDTESQYYQPDGVDSLGCWQHIQCHLVRSWIRRSGRSSDSVYALRDTSDFPPLADTTNGVGRVVLGKFKGDEENLFLGGSRL